MPRGRISKHDAIVKALPGTRKELAAKAKAGIASVARSVALLKEQGLVHVIEWKRSYHGPLQPVYAHGSGDDAPMPAPLTRKERQKRFDLANPGRKKEIKKAYYQRKKKKLADKAKLALGWCAPLF